MEMHFLLKRERDLQTAKMHFVQLKMVGPTYFESNNFTSYTDGMVTSTKERNFWGMGLLIVGPGGPGPSKIVL